MDANVDGKGECDVNGGQLQSFTLTEQDQVFQRDALSMRFTQLDCRNCSVRELLGYVIAE